MARVLRRVQEVVEEAQTHVSGIGAAMPTIPERLATEEDAVDALRAGVWWAGRRGRRPGVRLGIAHDHPYEVDTAPIAALATIMLSPDATKADLVETHEYVLRAFGKAPPRTDSIRFWTSRGMQRKHGYTVEGAQAGRYRYRHRLPGV